MTLPAPDVDAAAISTVKSKVGAPVERWIILAEEHRLARSTDDREDPR